MPKCAVCGKEYVESFAGFCSEHCFEQDFWTRVLDGNEVVIDGQCYHIGPEDTPSPFRGYGGAKFAIKMNDGRVVITHNLWNQGEIPERFFKGNNAEFVKNV